jgi:hypothetical protein
MRHIVFIDVGTEPVNRRLRNWLERNGYVEYGFVLRCNLIGRERAAPGAE